MKKPPVLQRIFVWDRFVRYTHWTVAALVIGELTIIDEDWAIHRWAGYAVLILVALRLAWGLIGTRYARFSAFPLSLKSARAHILGMLWGKREVHLSHNPLGALMAYNLWASLVAVCLTGILMTTRTFWGADWVEEIHEIIANWVLLSICLHVAGVLVESWRSKVRLVQAMISGYKEVPSQEE